MRYDKLTLPLGEAELDLRFHPRFTVLAGLSGQRRRHLIEAFAQLNRGALRGGSVTFVDSGGRRLVVDDMTGPDPSTIAQRSVGAWQSLLTVGAEDLGLPRPTDDPGRVTMQAELEAAHRQAKAVRAALRAAVDDHRMHTAQVAELASCEARIAELGSETDRHRHNRARALVELEQTREMLAALDAPAVQLSRDERLVTTTELVEDLAAEWAAIGERLDRLHVQLADRTLVDPDDLAALIDVPDQIPESLAAAVAERDRLRALRKEEKNALDLTTGAVTGAIPSDSRVLTLAGLDQELLWLTHRDVLLTTEALRTEQRIESERMLADPSVRTRIEEAHAEAEAASELADQRWMPSVITATITACVAAMLLITDLWVIVTPLLLIACIASLVVGVALPALGVRRTRQVESGLLGQVDAADISEYLARFNDDPSSERWSRVERVIADYEATHSEWRALVGDITPAEASLLEDAVHDWVARTDQGRRARENARVRREIDQTSRELTEVTQRLETLLEPFGLDVHTGLLSAALQDRVIAGRTARLQVELTDTEEAEAKLTSRLESELASLGFEGGSLSTRISAYGRELDAAGRRVRLRSEAPDRADLEARCDHLRLRLSVPEPHHRSDGRRPGEPGPGRAAEAPPATPEVAELRNECDRLRRSLAQFTDPDIRDLQRRQARIDARVASLEEAMSTERGLVVENPVDHLVETLIRYRPVWPSTEAEPAPAILDDPFAGTSDALKVQLLEAVVEVSAVVQMILLTDDPHEVSWARDAERRGVLTLIAPTPNRR